MRKEDNDWEITFRKDSNEASRININGSNYDSNEVGFAQVHATLLLVDAINDKNSPKVTCTCLQTQMPKWISVEERLPPNDVTVFICIYDGRPKVQMEFLTIGIRINETWCEGENKTPRSSKYGTVTHWMCLPDLPSKTNKTI